MHTSRNYDLWCRGYQLPVQYVIHTVGPIYDDHSPEEAKELLVSAHRCHTMHIMPHSYYQITGQPACDIVLLTKRWLPSSIHEYTALAFGESKLMAF